MNTQTAAAIAGLPHCVQRGSALLVAMVMIFMLSVMGASVMRSSTLERRMADNAVQASSTFQAAESATDTALNNLGWMNTSRAAGLPKIDTPAPSFAITEVRDDIGLDTRVELQYMGEAPAIGYSMGGGNFQAWLFVARGESAITAVRSASAVAQGAARLAPN